MLTDQERELETLDIHVNVGPQHPATHGVFRMVLTVSGEKVVDVVPHIGYMHRGAEKLSEGMDYRQALIYQDRTEYLAQFNAELCYCLAVEKLAGLEVPERAEYIRVILTELNRITSHYMFVGAFATDIGVYGTAFTYAFREREYIQEIFDAVSGDRMMYGYFRPGGVVWDVTDDFKDRVRWVCKQTRVGIDDIDRLLTKNEIFLTRCLDIGVISPVLFAMMVLMALVTTFMTTPLLEWVYPLELIRAEMSEVVEVHVASLQSGATVARA